MTLLSKYRPAVYVLVLISLLTQLSSAQDRPKTKTPRGEDTKIGKPQEKLLSQEQLAAIDVLRSVADNLKLDADNPEAAIAEARVADLLWGIDEAYAREVFGRAFAFATRPVASVSTVDKALRKTQLDLVRRRASALSIVLGLFGKHDLQASQALLKKYEQDQLSDQKAKGTDSSGRPELLMQIALELAGSSPAQAEQLGLLALSLGQIPASTGRLLFALSKHGKVLSDPVFLASIEAVRRNGYRYDSVLNSLSNYVFFSDGRVFADYQHDVPVLLALFLDLAETKQPDVNLYMFFRARILPILAVHAPDRLGQVDVTLNQWVRGFSAQELQDANSVSLFNQQQRALSDGFAQSLEDKLKGIENEKDPVVRDNLRRALAIGMMRGDPDQALTITAKIDDDETRKQTEDDIHLVLVSQKLKARNYDEAHKIAVSLNDFGLRARALAAIAEKANPPGGVSCPTELLSEALSAIIKHDNKPEKINVMLMLAREYLKCDSVRGFEVLSTAVQTANKVLASEWESPDPVRQKARVVAYTVVGGQELTTGEKPTLSSVSFADISGFAKVDFPQTQQIGYRLDDHILRAKFFISIAATVLQPTDAQKIAIPSNGVLR